MNPNERSMHLYDQYNSALGEQLKANTSQYLLAELNKNSSEQKAHVVHKSDSEYVMRELRQQADENPNVSRDAPHRAFLTGTPVSAKEIRAQIESLDNAIVIPQIIDGKVFFTTHGEADARTAVEGSASNPNLVEQSSGGGGVDLHKVKFTFGQLVKLLGPSTCQRLEREFVKQNQLSEAEHAQLRTARESVSGTLRTAQSVEPNLLSTRTANSVEPNLLSVYSARSPGIFTKNDGILTAQTVEPNLLSVRTANSVEPNLLSVHSARSPGIFTKNDGILTAQSVEPNLLSTRTANSREPNLLSDYTAKDRTTMSQLKAQSPGILTAQLPEPNLLSVRTARSSDSIVSLLPGESADVHTCLEIQSPTTGVHTALGFATPSGSAHEMRSSQDVSTALELLSSRSSQDVTTALEIQDQSGSQLAT